MPKRQAEQLAAPAAEDFDAFYEARRAAAGEPAPEESVVVLTFDGKGVVLNRKDLREATRREAERRRRQREQLSPFNRLQPGEKKHAKRMATVPPSTRLCRSCGVRRSSAELDAPAAAGQDPEGQEGRDPGGAAPAGGETSVASLEREPAEVVAEALLEAERHDPSTSSAGSCSSTGPRRSWTSWR